jgi:predicted RNase H-like HicB family nuclease
MKDINYYKKINYPLTVLQEEDGSYFAEYPDLKGCMTAADTFQEIYAMAEDAKMAWLETALENNIPIPEISS